MLGDEQGEDPSKKRGSKFESGFYLQDRRTSTKVYLILNAGPSDKCVVVRPNLGRRVMTRSYITSRIKFGEYKKIEEDDARVLWDEEFEAADIPFTEGELCPFTLFVTIPLLIPIFFLPTFFALLSFEISFI